MPARNVNIFIINGLNVLTGDNGGEGKPEVGSSVDNAEAPVSPRNSAPRLPDFCLDFDISPVDVAQKEKKEKKILSVPLAEGHEYSTRAPN